MAKIDLTLASGDYDRVRLLWDSAVNAKGLNLNVILLPVEKIFSQKFIIEPLFDCFLIAFLLTF